MSNIDWDFILEQEGFRLKGYVPNPEGSDSGVTIASGFDLGARSVSDLKGLSKEIIDLLTPYLGIKGAAADEVASNLVVSDEQAKTINEFAKKKELGLLKKRWKAKTGQSFDDLPMREATVITSVAFQYGNLATETPNFWRQVTSGDWDGAVGNLRNFGDDYGSRRNREADYFETGAQKKSEQFGIKTDPIRGIRAPEQIAGEVDFSEDRAIRDEVLSDTQDAVSPVSPDATVSAIPPSDSSRDQRVDRLIQAGQEDSDTPVEQVQLEAGQPDGPVVSPYNEVEVPDWFLKKKPVGPNLPTAVDQTPDEVINTQSGLLPEAEVPVTDMDPDEMIRRDIESVGPITSSFRASEFGDANPFYYNTNQKQIWGAAMRQFNPVKAASDYINEQLFLDDTIDPDYDNMSDPLVKAQPELAWRTMHSKNSAQTANIAQKLQDERADIDILSSSDSAFAEIGAALLTPSSVLPIAPLRFMKAASASKRFMSGAAFSMATVLPEQMALQAAREDKTITDSVMALALVSSIGGTVNTAFGPTIARAATSRSLSRDKAFEKKYSDTYESAGAAASPERARQTAYDTIERDAAKETGVKIEKLGFNPVYRMLKSSNPIVRGIAGEMVDMGGIMTKRVDEELSMSQSVETTFRTKYLSDLLAAIREQDTAYLAYRGKVASESDIVRSFQVIGVQAKDKFSSGLSHLSEVDFRVRIGKAMRRNDVDDIGDAASPYVTQAAQAARKQLNMIKKEAEEVRLFEAEIQRSLEIAKRSGDEAAVRTLTKQLDKVRSQGVSVNTAASYLPRLYRIDKIMNDPQRFISIVRSWAISTNGMSQREAQQFADEVFDSVTKSRPYLGLDNGDLDDLMSASGAKARTFEIPDDLIEEFLESDVEVLLKHHTRTMGMDIEIARRFGSVDMKSTIDDIISEYTRLIDEAGGVEAKQALRKQLENDLRDVRGLRDRLRGTYGASKDPHQLSSRFVRSMKSFNVIVGMGGAMVSSIPDAARVVMVEGFKQSYEKGLKIAFANQSSLIKQLSRKELSAAAVAADATLGLRAQAFADVGDIFGNRFALERILNASASAMFVLNGLNIWNQVMKEFSGNVTMLRMTEAIMQPWENLPKASKEKLLKNGIDQQSHMRMKQMIDRFGEQVDGQWMPNTELWTDSTMRLQFRNALNQNVERIIITPGAGDRALWTSTELGSMVTQFKSYGQAANVRMLTSGLQERDGAFWQGAFLLVGLGAMVNELKRAQYGIDRKETFDEKLINAIDRSGITGFFMDVNNAVEKLSNNRLGLRPATVDDRRFQMPTGAKLNAVLGPTAGNISTAASIMTDVITGEADQKTLQSGRFITPFGNHPVSDPFFDWAYGK